jgi:hypothetical protein
LAKINDNVYIVQLPAHFNISNTFNVKHFESYYPNHSFETRTGLVGRPGAGTGPG